jgi:hypothetical protein
MEPYPTLASTTSYQASKAKERERQLHRVEQIEKNIKLSKASNGVVPINGPATTIGLVLDGTRIKFLVIAVCPTLFAIAVCPYSFLLTSLPDSWCPCIH